MRLTTRAGLAVALVLVAAAGAAVLVYSFEVNTFTPRIEAYEIAGIQRPAVAEPVVAAKL